MQPSAKREGFATVPDITWDDIGALKEIREELEMSIMVRNAVPVYRYVSISGIWSDVRGLSALLQVIP